MTSVEDIDIDSTDTKVLFSSSNRLNWERGLELLEAEDNPDIEFILSLYFHSRYSEIEDELLQLLLNYHKSYTLSPLMIWDYVGSLEGLDKLNRLLEHLDREDHQNFLLSLSGLDHSLRADILSSISRSFIDSTLLIDLYSSADMDSRELLIESGGYIMVDEVIISWLSGMLLHEREDYSSLALISLVKHGDVGLLALSKRLIELPQRLQLSSIDIMFRNRFSEAYDQLVNILYSGSEEAVEKVVRGFSELDKTVIPYIVMALSGTDYSISLRLLKILEKFETDLYVEKILFLLYNYELKDYLLEKLFEWDSSEILYYLILDDRYGVRADVIDMSVKGFHPILLQDETITQITIKSLLSYYTLEEITEYLFILEKENLYIEDYKNIYKINSALKSIIEFEALQDSEVFISDYFSMSKNLSDAEEGESRFFDGLEEWLEKRDPLILKNSKEIKSQTKSSAEVLNERERFLTALSSEHLYMVIGYEESKRIIYNNYRNITYRFKVTAYNMILEAGYLHLLP